MSGPSEKLKNNFILRPKQYSTFIMHIRPSKVIVEKLRRTVKIYPRKIVPNHENQNSSF